MVPRSHLIRVSLLCYCKTRTPDLSKKFQPVIPWLYVYTYFIVQYVCKSMLGYHPVCLLILLDLAEILSQNNRKKKSKSGFIEHQKVCDNLFDLADMWLRYRLFIFMTEASAKKEFFKTQPLSSIVVVVY